MTRRQFNLLLVTALNVQSREIVRRLYARPQRGKLAPNKTTKICGKGRDVTTKKRVSAIFFYYTKWKA